MKLAHFFNFRGLTRSKSKIMCFSAFLLLSYTVKADDDTIGAIAWVQQSAEYQAIASQTFKNAANQIEEAVFDSDWTAAIEQFGHTGMKQLPNAILLDLDDTLISTMPYQAELALDNKPHSDAEFNKWVNTERARLVPHVLELIQKASSLGVTVLLISDRTCLPNPRDPCPIKSKTLKMLNRNSLNFPKDQMFFRGEFSDWNQDQSSRRAFIAQRYRILMIIGDDINQMIPKTSNLPASARQKLVSQYDQMWGSRWFLIPNPVYGGWRDTLKSSLKSNIKGY
ncbi:hypothetical protein N7931_01720 [Catenovulum sp. 2E275]|uniref:HAD family acid phosphatase n=1 Tax=Catenovulum sp. 2E275 TaxID=2980497 RepID=UPI0021D2343F|nr:HAD family acid phosphatase [Catenovulum sp. 2E275]MCU4674337.1 hypothetical protein [Catenovulum sp. 2E275]